MQYCYFPELLGRQAPLDKTAAPIVDVAEYSTKFEQAAEDRLLKWVAPLKEARAVMEKYYRVKANYVVDPVGTLDPDALRVTVQYRSKETQEILRVARQFFTQDGFKWLAVTANPLFHAVLQQYSLTAPQQKAVNEALRMWSKTRVLVKLPPSVTKYSDEAFTTYIDAFLNMAKTVGDQVELIRGIQKGTSVRTEEHALSAGSFKVVNAGNFSDEKMAGFVAVVEKADKALKGIGWGRACYGDVNVTETTHSRGNVMAYYLLKYDEMFIRGNAKPGWDLVRTVIHELAHRMEEKFLSGKQREILQLYQKIRSSTEKSPPTRDVYPQVGAEATIQNKVLRVKYPDFHSGTVWAEDVAKSNTYKVPIKMWLTETGTPWQPADALTFVTPYAGKNASENFAEMVSHYAIGTLPANQVELLLPLLS